MCATQESYIPTNGLCNMHTLPSMHMVSIGSEGSDPQV